MASTGRGGDFASWSVTRDGLTTQHGFENADAGLALALEDWLFGADAPAGITGTATAALGLGVDATGTVSRTGVVTAALALTVAAAGTVASAGGSAITTAADGNWSSPGTWTGGVVPGDGDTVIYNHNLTVDVATTVGHSPGNSDAVKALACGTANKVLTVNAPLTIRGDFSVKGNTTKTTVLLVEGNGAGIELDSSASASPLTTKYRFIVQAGNNEYTVCHFNGTATDRVYLRSNAGGGNAYLTRAGFSVGGWLKASYCDFTRIGDGTNPFFDYYLGNNAGAEFILQHCIGDACGIPTSATAVVSGGEITVTDTSWENTAHASKSMVLPTFTNAGTKVISGNCFDKQVDFGQGAWTVEDNVFHEGYVATAGTMWTSSERNIVRRSTQPALNIYASLVDELWYKAGTISNAHHLVYGITASLDLTGVIFATEDANAVGDAAQPGAPSGARLYRNINCILLPDETSGVQSGKLQGAGGNANVTVENYHCTYISTAAGETGTGYGETYNGHDGIVKTKSCLAWSPSAGGASIAIRQAGSVQLSDATAWDYNAGWNLRTGSDGPGYNSISAGTIFSSGSPGAHDVPLSGDPFVDYTRNVATWDASLGGPGTSAHAFAEIAKKNHPSGYNTAYNFADLLAYLRGGFDVTDPSLWNTGHDGATIGAGVYIDTSNDGAATVALSLGVAATGTVLVQGSATAGLSLSATATGTVPRTATVTAALSLGATATGSLASTGRTGTATVALSLGVQATGTVPRTGTAAAPLVLGVVAAGTVPRTGAVAAALSLGATAAGQVLVQGAVAAPLVLTAAATGTVETSALPRLILRLTAANGAAYRIATAGRGPAFTFTPRG